jgi:hypothetical protein
MPLSSNPAWELLAYTKLSGTSNSIDISNLPDRKLLYVLLRSQGQNNAVTAGIRFNGDSGNNYADNLANTRSSIRSGSSSLTTARLVFFFIYNVLADQKQVWTGGEQGTASNANTIQDGNTAGVWSNTSAVINEITVVLTDGTSTFNSGSEVWVYGMQVNS